MIAYRNAVEKWISESEVPLSLYDYSTKKTDVKVCVVDGYMVKRHSCDMIKFEKSTASIFVHILSDEAESIPKWIPISTLGDQAMEVYKSIFWITKDDLIVIDGDTHSGMANMVWCYSDQPLYFIHEDGHIVIVDWYDGGIDDFIKCKGEFAVHKYEWSIAMRDIDEREEASED